jgi:hypothetical protein
MRRESGQLKVQRGTAYLYDVDNRTCHTGLTRCAVQLAAVSNLPLGIGTFHTNWCYLSTNQDHCKVALCYTCLHLLEISAR